MKCNTSRDMRNPRSEPEASNSKPFNNCLEILKHADSAVDVSFIEKLIKQLHAGVYLDKKTKKYWLDKSYSNCFMLYARALVIIWSDRPEYWKWGVIKEDASGTQIEVAELLNVCWLEVRGRMDTKMLLPGILYQASFIVMLTDQAHFPVTLRLVLPGGKKQEHGENMEDKSKMRWIEIPGGEFVLSAQDIGDVEISMHGNEGSFWKRGLVIKGVVIKARNFNS